MKRCPKCGGKKFAVTAHVAQLWLVDDNGSYLATLTECEEVTHGPDDDDMWACASKKCNWCGLGRDCNVSDSETGDSAMTEEEYQELKKSAISKKEDRELKLFLSAVLLDKMGYAQEAAERKQRFEKITGKDYKDELLKLVEKEEA